MPGEVEFYPNPANNYVIANTELTNSRISITDVDGREMNKFSISGNRIDVSSFQPGFYFVRIARQQQVYIEKLLIER